MNLRLKEDPREWRTFGLSLSGALLLLGLLFGWRRGFGPLPGAFAGVSVLLAGAAWLRPRLLRPVYRVGLRVGHALGQVVGRIVLVAFFVIAVVPLGLLLRLLGRDLLRLRRNPVATTYWEPARRPSRLDRMF